MIKLSQCMIVKNEEKNIETALGWAKPVAYEQIVVDTGSTDATVELAEIMGAKIYRFKWINDFAAAKNFAIEQAKGDWIAFLDADEYFSQEDTAKLMEQLAKIESDEKLRETCLGISMPWVNVDDGGKPMTIASQARIFKNDPTVRYVGRIHESLSIKPEGYINNESISIIHTGYSESAHMETGKSERNAELLRDELKKNPNDTSLKAYLANALSISTNEAHQKEAEKLFDEVIKSKTKIDTIHKIKAYMFFINKHKSITGELTECEKICRKALAEFPGLMDFEYLLADTLTRKGDYTEAWELLKRCEEKLVSGNYTDESIMLPADPTALFGQMIITAQKLNDIESVILYSTHILTMDKTRKSVLGPCIATLVYYGVTDKEIIELLSNIYDMRNKEDIQFIAQTAKEFGATEFAEKLLGS